MDCRIDTIPNRGRPPTIPLRRHWRDGGRVRKETVANLIRHPPWLVEGIRTVVRAKAFLPDGGGRLKIRRSLPHGHAAAILGAMKDLGFERILGRGDCRSRRLALAAIAARVADPLSKLATARILSEGTASSSLGAMPGLGEASGTRCPACWTGFSGASHGSSGASRTAASRGRL